ncbi:hypothetical protein [Xanthocytophaga agilis]|uniref:Bacterial surface antigen (D15) domain-containing protein n=1 Tax=Xanthocytophaga agilis TaxID=3048010 RepID=A0AAE3R8L2_9BACT|nr:hypothetical protein [Xanthocytophaga agilis]MDJ1503425.1 hypothetical protein [Xanthocytophaga agilis]
MAQQGDAVSDPDSLNQKILLKELRLDSADAAKSRIDTTLLYKKLKRKMQKHRFSRAVFEFLFRDPYSRTVSRTPTSPIDPNCTYEGSFIGNIQIQRLDPFGPRVTDTLRLPANWFEKAGNTMHRDTREAVIRKSLMFQRGYPFVASMISDNERILRLTPNLLDARIYAVPRKGRSDTVDILVVTQDVWSINGSIDTDFQQTIGVNVDDLNFLGLGHEKALGISYSQAPHPYTHKPRGWGIQSLYRVPYIGKTFISGTLQYVNRWTQERYAVIAQRKFLTPNMKYAGGLELSRNRIYVESNPFIRDSEVFPVGYDYADFWLGRAFRTQWTGERTRMVLAARVIGNRYWERPEVRADTNQLYQHRWLNLYSIGFSTRNYLRDVLIYGFGRTEDVPYGSLVSFTTGMERREFGVRSYIGMKMAHGQYFQRFGYLLLGFNAGSYIRNGLWEQGAWRGEVNYFSRLLTVGTSQLRQFINLRYTRGFGRFNGEYIDINNANGIRGITNVGLRGQQSLVLNIETVLFTPLNILGFQVAMFGYVDLGWIGTSSKEVVKVPLYQGYGIGIRLRNENLTFNTFQFRLGFYNGFAGLISPFRTEFSEIPRSRLTDFDINAPEVVPFGALGVQ